MSASEKEMRERAARKAQEESAKVLRQERLEITMKKLAQIKKQREEDEAAWVVLGDDEWEMIEINK